MQSPRHPHDRVRFGNVGADAFAAPADAVVPEATAPSKAVAADAAAVADAGKDEHTQMQELLAGYLVGGMTCNLVFLGERCGGLGKRLARPAGGSFVRLPRCAPQRSAARRRCAHWWAPFGCLLWQRLPTSPCSWHCLQCRLGLYRGLKEQGPCSAADLACALALNER